MLERVPADNGVRTEVRVTIGVEIADELGAVRSRAVDAVEDDRRIDTNPS